MDELSSARVVVVLASQHDAVADPGRQVPNPARRPPIRPSAIRHLSSRKPQASPELVSSPNSDALNFTDPAMNALRYNALTSRATRALVARPTPFPPSYCRPPLARFAPSAIPRSMSNSARRTSSQAKDEVPASDSVAKEPKQETVKRSRTSATTSPTTLRKVAVEAQRKRMRAKSELPNTEEAKVRFSKHVCSARTDLCLENLRLLRCRKVQHI